MILFALLVHSNVVYESCLQFGLHISDGYSAIALPEKPISLRPSLSVVLRVYIRVSFPEGYLGKLRADCVVATSTVM